MALYSLFQNQGLVGRLPFFPAPTGDPVLFALAAGPATANAEGWYFSEAFGHTEVDGPMKSHFSESLFTARIAIGRQSGPWAIDAYVQLMDLQGAGPLSGSDFAALTLGVDVRYIMKVSGPLQVYLRGGLNKMTVWSGSDADYARGDVRTPLRDDYEGRGITYGAGVRLSGKVRALGLLYWPLFFFKYGPKVNASIYLDTSRQFVRLHHPRARSLDGSLDTWLIGFSIGGGF